MVASFKCSKANKTEVLNSLENAGLQDCVHHIANINQSDNILIYQQGKLVFNEKRNKLHSYWSSTSFEISKLRDNPICAESENKQLLIRSDGLTVSPKFDINESISAPYINVGKKPKIAILREQGINGHVEMAAAFTLAGFAARDVHMSDILSGRISLSEFHGISSLWGIFIRRRSWSGTRLGKLNTL